MRFDFDENLNNRVKRLKGIKWSRKHKAWYVADTPANRRRFKLPAKTAANEVHQLNQPALEKLVETLQLKGYSPNTIRTYRNEFVQLLQVLKSQNVDELDATRIRSYFLYCVNELKLFTAALSLLRFGFECQGRVRILNRLKTFKQ